MSRSIGKAGSRVGCQQAFPGGDYTEEQRQWLQAMERYQRCRRRRYPTYREVLAVALSLGYRLTAPPSDAHDPTTAS